MNEFWESAFRNNDKMWGESPTDNSKNVLKLFQKNKIKNGSRYIQISIGTLELMVAITASIQNFNTIEL